MQKSLLIVFCSLAMTLPAPRVSTAQPADQLGRTTLNESLDAIAAGFTAQRSRAIEDIRTLMQAKRQQAEARSKLAALIGSFPERTPLRAQVLGETKAEGFRIRKVIFESQPNFPVTALLYVPGNQDESGKRAAILLTPGHDPTG